MKTSTEEKINDTICAISTAPGVGGIAVVRISGPKARQIANKIWQGKSLTDAESHKAIFGRIIDTQRNNELLDEAVATIFISPKSFTGEDTVELSVHGSRYVQQRLLEILIANGARMAQPGEFTRRAFANGKMDLAQAEAIADVIASNSRAAHRLAASQMKGTFSRRLDQLRQRLLELASLLELELDFSEEEVEFASRTQLRAIAQEIHDEVTRLRDSFAAGQAIKEGIPVAIIGPTNAGKSSLLNALLGDDRAIVSDIHGTTRDTIEETLTLGDYTFRFIDTAGIRPTTDPIEALGIDRSRAAAARASIILSLTPASPASSPTSSASPASSSNSSASSQPPFRGEAESTSTASASPASSSASPASSQPPFRGEADSTPHPQSLQAITIPLLTKIDLLPPSSPLSEQPSLSFLSSISEQPFPPSPLSEQPSPSSLSSISEQPFPPSSLSRSEANPRPAISPLPISSKTGEGLSALRTLLISIANHLRGTADEDTPIVTNLRHAQALDAAATTTRAILDALDANLPGDLIAQDLRATIHHLSTITGALTTPDILATIFTRFCIGK